MTITNALEHKRNRITGIIDPRGEPFDWWRALGTIPEGKCRQAQRAKGAVDLTSSYINLVDSNIYNAYVGTVPTFDTQYGWIFNGTDQFLYVDKLTEFQSANNFSIAIRATTNTLSGGDNNLRTLCSNENVESTTTYIIRLDTADDKIQFYLGGSAWRGMSSATISVDTDYVICCTYDNSYLRIYINGDSSGTPASTSGNVGAPTTPARIGGSFYSNRLWSGYIAAIAFYNIALSSTQVESLYTTMISL